MNFFLILFFVSLGAISFMVARKWFLVKGTDQNHHLEHSILEPFDFDKLKYLVIKNLKKTAHILLWIFLRVYILSIDFINKKKNKILTIIKTKFNKYKKEENKEASKFIKIISEYRHKIKKIKHKIKEEEGIE